jgi:ribonuclease HI
MLAPMPSFSCHVCGKSFDVPAKALAKYPGWRPRACHQHKQGGRARAGAASNAAAPVAGTGDAAVLAEAVAPPRRTSRARAAAAAPVAPAAPGAVLRGHSPQSGVFTDGSASPNPGPGGWGLVWVKDGRVLQERSGHEPRTTNNRMELTALIAAFELVPEDASLTVYSDSRLCVDTITKWAPNWERRGWKKDGGEIKNLELVQRLLALARSRPNVRLEWIAAHVGHRWNEHADQLATAWMKDRQR